MPRTRKEVSRDDRSSLPCAPCLGVLRDRDENDTMRHLLGSALRMLIDAEATAHIRAARHECTASRTTQSNGTRDKAVATAAGDVTVKMN